MREILFKAKRLDNGEWVEGSDLNCKGATTCKHYIRTFDDEWGVEWVEVDETTICQYSGLTDKNGNKIWENDIIRCGRNTVVSWDEHFASWCLTRKGWLFKHFFGESQNPEDCEVIGNIFDNPELLEGGGEDE